MNEKKVVSILDISYQIVKHLNQNGGWDGLNLDTHGWVLRKGCYTYRSLPEARRKAESLFYACSHKMHPSSDDMIGSLAVCLLDVYKRDRKLKSDLSEEMLKSTKINNVNYTKNGFY